MDTTKKGVASFSPEALREKYRLEREKRLRPDGNAQYRDLSGVYADFDRDPYVEPGFTRPAVTEKIDVLIVGGGFGGMLAAVRLREAGVDPSASSRRAAISAAPGTGTAIPAPPATSSPISTCRCSRRSATSRREKYAKGSEIFAHCQRIGRHFDLYETALFQTQIERCDWDEDAPALDRHDRPRRQARGALRDHRCAASCTKAEAARHPRHRDLQGPQLPHHPLGLCLYRRRPDGQSRPARRQARRHHRHRRDRGPGDPRTSARRPSSSTSSSARPRRSTCAANQPTDPDWAKTLKPGWQEERIDNFTALVSGGEQRGRPGRRRLDRSSSMVREPPCRDRPTRRPSSRPAGRLRARWRRSARGSTPSSRTR